MEWNLQCLHLHADTVRIEGHTDERGTDEYNIEVGRRRALAARQFFLDNGFEASRFRVVTYGASRPAGQRGGEGSNQLNERVEFVFE